LDNGAHLVLIRPEMVADLGLNIRKLHTPQSITVAINSQQQTFQLVDYVVLSLSSLNNSWTSRPVRALIAHDLCTSILLGLPFLKHNKIVIDHENDTAIAKDSGFDLLNENKPSSLTTPPPLQLSPKNKRDNLIIARKHFLEELKWKCAERCTKIKDNNHYEPITTPNYIASIKKTIECLENCLDWK
jgi:hypothetical protein